jgi:hypothetical protein
VSFLAASGLVAAGGGAIMMAIKSGSLAVLAASDRRAGEIERGALSLARLRHAAAYSPEFVLDSVRRFGGRAARLAVGLALAYVGIGAGWLVVVTASISLSDWPWAPSWPLVVLAATSAGIVGVAAANLLYDLLRVIVVTDDCGIRAAAQKLRACAPAGARPVLGIFSVVTLASLAGFAAAAPATAVFTFVAWVPVVGLIAAPLQIVGWLVQGLVFQYVAIVAVAAYQAQYRRLTAADAPILRPVAVRS